MIFAFIELNPVDIIALTRFLELVWNLILLLRLPATPPSSVIAVNVVTYFLSKLLMKIFKVYQIFAKILHGTALRFGSEPFLWELLLKLW